jgi:hypothetical protein
MYYYFPTCSLAESRGLFNIDVTIAQLLLGYSDGIRAQLVNGDTLSDEHFRCSHDTLLGHSILDAIIRTGSVSLVRLALESQPSVDLNDYYCSALRVAVETRSMEMINLILNPPGGHEPHHRYGRSFELAIVTAVRLRALEIAWFLLDLRTVESERGFLVHEGIREACYHGDIDIVRLLFEKPLPGKFVWATKLECCITPLEIAARAGHLNIVQYLLSRGVNPRGKADRETIPTQGEWKCVSSPINYVKVHASVYRRQLRTAGAMFGAAVHGHIDVARALIAAGIELSTVEWEKIALGATELGQTEFLRWMFDTKLVPRQRSEKFDLMGYACVWGSPSTVTLLVERGFSLQQLCYFESSVVDSPLLVALNWSRPDICNVLTALGAPLIDPLGSRFKLQWEEGYYPRKPQISPVKSTAGVMGTFFRGG